MVDVIIMFIAEGNCQDLNHDPDANLIHSHLPESKAHPLLDIISIKNQVIDFKYTPGHLATARSPLSTRRWSAAASGAPRCIAENI